METVFRIRTSELNAEFVQAVKALFGGNRELEITIQSVPHPISSVEETKAEYFSRIEQSVKEIDQGKVVRFSAEEFQALADKLQA